MDFAQWRQLPNGFNFDLLSNDMGFCWIPEAHAGGVESDDHCDYSIPNVNQDLKSRNHSLITHCSIPLNLPRVPSIVQRISAGRSPLRAKNTITHSTTKTWRKMIVEAQRQWVGHDALCKRVETLLWTVFRLILSLISDIRLADFSFLFSDAEFKTGTHNEYIVNGELRSGTRSRLGRWQPKKHRLSSEFIWENCTQDSARWSTRWNTSRQRMPHFDVAVAENCEGN